MLNSTFQSLTRIFAVAFIRTLRYISPRSAGNFCNWYRTQFIRYPRWVGAIRAEMRVRLEGGFELIVPVAEEIGIQLMSSGSWQPELWRRLLSVLRAGDVFVDIGANMGYFTILASQHVGKEGLVVSAEPSPGNLQRLARNVELNACDNVVICSFALSDKVGYAKLSSTPWHNSGLCSLRPSNAQSHTSTFTARVDGLLSALPATFDRIRVIKIDVEGHEPQVVDGLLPLLLEARIDFIVLEASPEWFSVADLIEVLSNHGYECEVKSGSSWRRIEATELPNHQTELWFTRRDLKEKECISRAFAESATC